MSNRRCQPTLFILGDSHSLWSYAGVKGAKIFWRGPLTMHRAARDGIKSLVPKNCRPNKDDILVLSFGEIDCRVHVPKQTELQGNTTQDQVDALCDRFEIAFKRFSRQCPATLAISCILPPPRIGLPIEHYADEERCFEDAKIIRERMNHRLSQIAPLVDFRSYFTDEEGGLKHELSDHSVHIDSRNSQPVADAVNHTFNTSYETVIPVWPNPKPMAQPAYISPLKKIRRRVKSIIMDSIRKPFFFKR